MIYYNIIISLTLLSLLFLTLWNLKILSRKKTEKTDDERLPFISVLVPARNEEDNIEICLKSLLNQDYPEYEVIVLDDNSTDNTYKILQEIKITHSELIILKGEELPDGWTGKNYACHCLSQKAKGSWLLFTDADTIHNKISLKLSMETAISKKADLLTLIPYQITKTFFEKLIIPLLHYITLTLLPFYFLEKKGYTKFSIGIGQFMLFNKNVFEKIGGYESVKDKIVEDVWLARKIKEAGYRLIAADGMEMLSCRMYKDIKGVWEGFSKNIFPGLNKSVIFSSLVILMLFAFNILPYILILYCFLFEDQFFSLYFILTQVIILLITRLLLCYKFKTSILSAFIHPLGILFLIIITINSIKWNIFGKGSKWKGRVYSDAN